MSAQHHAPPTPPVELVTRGWGLRRKVTLTIVLPALLASVLGVGLTTWTSARSLIAEVGDRRSGVADYYAGAVAPALWHYDIDNARLILEGLFHDPDFAGGRLEADLGRVVVDIGKPIASDLPEALLTRRPIAYTGDDVGPTILGTLTLAYDDSRIDAEVARLTITNASLLLLVIGLVTGAALIGHRVFVATPMARFLSSIDRARREDVVDPVAVSGHDEFAILAKAHNELVGRLDAERKALAIARDEALAAVKAKSQFLSNVSHELRTPLNGVIGLLTVMMDQGMPKSLRGHGEAALGSAEHLLALVNDLLDATQLEAGAMPLRLGPTDIRVIVNEVVTLLGPRAQQRGDQLELVLVEPLASPLVMDAEKVRRLIINLVGNAIKFTENGRVTISVATEPDPDFAPDGSADVAAGVVLRVTVADTGIGISEADIPKLFQRFVQLDASSTRQYGGSGLGLSICRELVELMGGRIGVNSETGVGSVFWLDLPMAVAAPTAPDALGGGGAVSLPEEPDDLPLAMHVLVVDDIKINRALLVELLRTQGHTAAEAENALLAVAKLAGPGRFDMVLMDLEMPEMDGRAATELIRALPPPNDHCPVVAVSAGVDAATVTALMAHGFDAVVAKPVRWDALARAMRVALVARGRMDPGWMDLG